MTSEEQNILAECRKGDLKRFGALYDKYVRRIYDFVYYKTYHKETAEDLVSRTFMKAIENVRRFDPDRGSFSSWLYAIARNAVIDHYRTKKTDANIEDFFDLSERNDIAADIDREDNLKKIRVCLSGLSPVQRELVTMRVWQEMSYAEIAGALGRSEESCRMMFSRAVAKLKSEMPMALFIILLLSLKM